MFYTISEEEANTFTSNLINLIILIGLFIFTVVFIFAKSIVMIFASGFDNETLVLAVKLTRITIISIFFNGVISIITGYLQIKNRYLLSAIFGLPANLIVIVSILLSKTLGVTTLAIGYVMAIAIQLILLLIIMKQERFQYTLVFEFRNNNIKSIIHMGIPLILGVSINEINILIDRTIASKVAIGGISALNYSSKLNGLIQGVFVMSISTVLYPILSKMSVGKDFPGIKRVLKQSINAISLLIIPAIVGSMVFSTEIISILFGRGAFSQDAITMTSTALRYYSIGMLGIGLQDIISKVFFSLEDMKTPMINSTIGIIVNIILNIILSKYLGIGGLALATSIASYCTVALLLINLRKKVGTFGFTQIIIAFIKILVSAVIMGVVSRTFFLLLTRSISSNISLVISIIIAIITYTLTIYFMKIEDADIIFDAIKQKIGK